MSPTILLALVAAAVGYSRPRAKRKKLPSAALWGAAAYVGTRYLLPRVGINLPS